MNGSLIYLKIFSYIDNLIENSKFEEEKKKLLIQKKSQINSIISPQGWFKEVESQASSGLIKGSWLLYDDIQFATPDLLSILAPLCSVEPSINLFSAKNCPKYTSELKENLENKSNIKKIHDNFNLFITFNPKYYKNSHGLDPILESKCLCISIRRKIG